MSTSAIDTARTSERLSVFLSEIGNKDPIDNHFQRFPVLDLLRRKQQVKDGGRQVQFSYDSGENPTFQWFSDYDEFNTTASDTALTLIYPYHNLGGSLPISWEEQREVAGKDHATFDLIKHKRANALKTGFKKMSEALFATTQASNQITTLAVGIDSTGSVGSKSQTDDADWASYETGSGSFATQGLTDMRGLYNQIWENGGMVDTIATSRTVYQYYENEVDPDVRYSIAQTAGASKNAVGGRGFGGGLEFNGIPIIMDANATADGLYMWDSENLFLCMDSAGNFDFTDFRDMPKQMAQVAFFLARGNLIITRRKSTGKLTGITA